MAYHLGLDFNIDVLLSVVDTTNAADHLRHNDHVPQVRLHSLWLLAIGSLTLGLTQLLQHSDRLAFDATAELSALASLEELHEILIAHVQQLIQINSTVGVLAEGALLWLVLFGHDWMIWRSDCWQILHL